MQAIRFKHYAFKPALVPTLVTIALLYVMISLGFWQLDRAEYKSNLQTIIESRQQLSSIELTLLDFKSDNWMYTPAYTQGEYDTQHHILLDNQIHNAQAGYSVLTPFKINETTAILVNRGWISHSGHRDQLPDLTLDRTGLTLNGIITPPPATGLVLSDNANTYVKWPTVLQYINTREIQQQLPYNLLPGIFTLNNAEDTRYTVLPIHISMRSEKHTAYAFQWFALSLALIIIYIVVNTKSRV